MAMRNDHDGYGLALPRIRHGDRDRSRRLRGDDRSTPDFRDTMLELTTTIAGILGLFSLLIALVKIFA